MIRANNRTLKETPDVLNSVGMDITPNPLLGMGIKAEWRIISASEQFFSITKSFHNALQGAEYSPTKDELDTYLATNTANARRFVPAYDAIIVHDPQPAAMCHISRTEAPSGFGVATSTRRRQIRMF